MAKKRVAPRTVKGEKRAEREEEEEEDARTSERGRRRRRRRRSEPNRASERPCKVYGARTGSHVCAPSVLRACMRWAGLHAAGLRAYRLPACKPDWTGELTVRPLACQSLLVLLKAAARICICRTAASRAFQAITMSDSQQRRAIEQLRRESQVRRLPVSSAVDDLKVSKMPPSRRQGQPSDGLACCMRRS